MHGSARENLAGFYERHPDLMSVVPKQVRELGRAQQNSRP